MTRVPSVVSGPMVPHDGFRRRIAHRASVALIRKDSRDFGAPSHPLSTVTRASGVTTSFGLARMARVALRLPVTCDA